MHPILQGKCNDCDEALPFSFFDILPEVYLFSDIHGWPNISVTQKFHLRVQGAGVLGCNVTRESDTCGRVILLRTNCTADGAEQNIIIH